MPWRDSISRLIAPVSSLAGGDGSTRPRRQQPMLNLGTHSSAASVIKIRFRTKIRFLEQNSVPEMDSMP
jgi:hypothetical protein